MEAQSQFAENIVLPSGVEIPLIATGPGIIGYKTRSNAPNSPILNLFNRAYAKFIGQPKTYRDWVDALAYSFSIGYRLLDNSSTYGNWQYVRRAIEMSGVGRDKLFVTTRIDNHAQMQGESAIRADLESNLRELGSDHVDLLQFHWPVTGCYAGTWRVMESLLREGKCRVLGVANCHRHHLEEIFKICSVRPEVNQIEVHPLFTQKPLIDYCKSQNILVESYSPIARFDDRLMRLPLLRKIAEAHGKSAVQVILRWHIQQGLIPVIRSWNKIRLREDLEVFDFTLTPEELAKIDGININARIRYDPDNCDFSIL